MPRLLALTQRLCRVESTGEIRDSLDRAWGSFLSALGLDWIALPNGTNARIQPPDQAHAVPVALSLAERLGVDALLLTGGEDWGQDPARDATEWALLDWAADRGLPVVGVCRGMQVMLRRLGGDVLPADPGLHRARRHPIRRQDGSLREVNSYHNFRPGILPSGLEILATCPGDDSVEAFRGHKTLGLMWHPERERVPDPEDLKLLRQHLHS